MTYTLLEAGEKVTNPPLVVTQDVVRSDVAMYAGGLVWVDRDYDERLGDAVRPLNIDARGIPVVIDAAHAIGNIQIDLHALGDPEEDRHREAVGETEALRDGEAVAE
jgi:hypothetical protein